MKRCILYLLWFVGACFLLFLSHRYQASLHNVAIRSFHPLLQIWASFYIPFVWGMYFSLLLISKWHLKINMGLLICVFIPSVVISIWAPIAFLTTLFSGTGYGMLYTPQWLLAISDNSLLPIVSGFTLVYGLFGQRK